MSTDANDFVIPVSVSGVVAAGTLTRLVAPFDFQVLAVTASAGTAPTADLGVDLLIDGASIFDTESPAAKIASGDNDSTVLARPAANYSTATVDGDLARDYQSGGIVAVGTALEVVAAAGASGSDLMVLLHCVKT